MQWYPQVFIVIFERRWYQIQNIDQRLFKVCKDLNATSYKAQPMGKSYLNTSLFNEANIKVDWMEYNNYSNINLVIV